MSVKINKIAQLRKNYNLSSLSKEKMHQAPFSQFDEWFQDALNHPQVIEPNAMTLATASQAGKPSARTVLLKGYSPKGWRFFTNYNSRKGKDLTANPQVALLFFWHPLERQIRIEGNAQKLSRKDSEAYFQSRPKGSQIGAIASPQSQIITSRSLLTENVQKLEEQYKTESVLPCPDNWGGFLVIPHLFEFWQGRPSRLHDRFQYSLQADGTWKMDRLAP